MTHAQQTHTGTNAGAFVPAAAAALVMAAALGIATLVGGQVSVPTFGDQDRTGASSALLQAGSDWQAQREQQAGIGGLSGAEKDMGMRWEQQERTITSGVQDYSDRWVSGAESATSPSTQDYSDRWVSGAETGLSAEEIFEQKLIEARGY